MNAHLDKAIQTYGDKLQDILTWHLCYGGVVSDDEVFAMGFPSDSLDPCTPVERHHGNTFFVTYCAGNMRKAASIIADGYDFIAYRRDFKPNTRLRAFPMAAFHSKLT